MNKLLVLKTVQNTNGLRALCNHVKAQVRSLLFIVLNHKDYGPIPIPVYIQNVLTKLPFYY